jgi:hypothetical protein
MVVTKKGGVTTLFFLQRQEVLYERNLICCFVGFLLLRIVVRFCADCQFGAFCRDEDSTLRSFH